YLLRISPDRCHRLEIAAVLTSPKNVGHVSEQPSVMSPDKTVVPAIHVFGVTVCCKNADGRDKPGHDGLRSQRFVVVKQPQAAFAVPEWSGRLSITLSTRPNSLAMSEVRNLSRSSASSIAL